MSEGPKLRPGAASGADDVAFDTAAQPWAPYQAIVANAVEATGARLAVLVRLDAATQTLRPVAWAGQHTATVQKAYAAVQAAFPGFDPFRVTTRVDVNPIHRRMLEERRSVAGPLLDLCAGVVDRRVLQIGVSILGIRHAYMCPLLVGGEPEGSLTFLDWHAPDERRRHTYEAFARQVALTLENARLLGSLREQMARVQASEERLRLALSAGSMGWWEWDLKTDRLSYGDALAEVFGFPAGGTVRTRAALLEAAHPTDRAEVEALLDRAVALGAGFRLEFRVGPADGPVRWVDVAGQVQADAAGRPTRIVGVARDVSALKRAEAALREVQQTEDRLEGILLAAREVGHLLSNDLQLPMGTLEMIERLPGVPQPARDMAEEALGWLATAQGHVRQFQRVVRVETKQTPLGPALDLERSTEPISPC